jgi:hypothetical protein
MSAQTPDLLFTAAVSQAENSRRLAVLPAGRVLPFDTAVSFRRSPAHRAAGGAKSAVALDVGLAAELIGTIRDGATSNVPIAPPSHASPIR